MIWNRDLLIRLASSFSGMRVHPLAIADSTGPDTGELHAEVMPDAIHDGRFIEVITTVAATSWTGSEEDGLAQAKANALAALGLVTRHLGENTIREEFVLAHKLVALPGRRDEVRIDLHTQIPSSVTDDDLTKLDVQMATLLGASAKRKALDTALRWYVHGLTSTNPRDRLIAHYIGVEAILSDHTKGLVALASKLANDEMYPDLLRPLVEKHGQSVVDALIGRGKNLDSPDSQRMEQYSVDHCWDEEPARIRKRTRNALNPSLHGGSDTVGERDASAA